VSLSAAWSASMKIFELFFQALQAVSQYFLSSVF
jgi:hypothetical protein